MSKMTCKDCIHGGLCYKENDYENFPDVCGSYIPERQQGEWIIKPKENSQSALLICNKCKHFIPITVDKNFCPNCGADMSRRKSRNA